LFGIPFLNAQNVKTLLGHGPIVLPGYAYVSTYPQTQQKCLITTMSVPPSFITETNSYSGTTNFNVCWFWPISSLLMKN